MDCVSLCLKSLYFPWPLTAFNFKISTKKLAPSADLALAVSLSFSK
ncbi:hypothetical protein [Spiroplasma endosymbiont of Tricholauxania praeusta]